MLSFAYPEFLYLMLIVPVVVALYIFARSSRIRNLKRFGRIDVLTALMPDVSKYKPGIKLILQLIAVVLIIIVLARPRAGAVEQTVKVRGIEVMVALDVSNSMNASSNDDPKSVSRLQRAKLLLERLIDTFGDDKVGLIVFAGNAYTQLPITADFTSAKMFINSISTDMVSAQGTAIGAAIKLAMNSFSGNEKTQKTIIVITDGENFEDDAVSAAKSAADRGIQVNVIGVGSTKGSPIPAGNGAWMKDLQGNVVTTYLNEETAQRIAKAGGGIYVNGTAGNAASLLSKELDKLAKSDLQKVVYSQNSEQFPIFAWLALVFLVADLFVLERKNSWLRKINFFTKENKQHYGNQ
ncbi:MAG TPA: VWA domain-containing protein [Candidatus Avimuribaculum pullicola]|nr:VWA domain-containing protein [Candidatus Avimuribaculum pullicola]